MTHEHACDCGRRERCREGEACRTERHDPWGWLGAIVLWFIVLTVLFWLIYYSLKPNFVVDKNTGTVDTSKVLLAAVITALILVIIIWIIKVVAFRP